MAITPQRNYKDLSDEFILTSVRPILNSRMQNVAAFNRHILTYLRANIKSSALPLVFILPIVLNHWRMFSHKRLAAGQKDKPKIYPISFLICSKSPCIFVQRPWPISTLSMWYILFMTWNQNSCHHVTPGKRSAALKICSVYKVFWM